MVVPRPFGVLSGRPGSVPVTLFSCEWSSLPAARHALIRCTTESSDWEILVAALLDGDLYSGVRALNENHAAHSTPSCDHLSRASASPSVCKIPRTFPGGAPHLRACCPYDSSGLHFRSGSSYIRNAYSRKMPILAPSPGLSLCIHDPGTPYVPAKS
jgi:hypothetical protein